MIENRTIEFKREYTNDIKYAVVAFANTEGGKIYVGLNDDGIACGVKDIDETLLQISNMIRYNIRPDVTMFIDYNVEIIDRKNVIVVTVQRGTARPYYLYSKGIRPEGVYVRSGASSIPASETLILNMIKETSGDCYENARALNQQLTFEKAKKYFHKKNLKLEETQLRTLHIRNEDGTYSNIGMLLSDQCVHSIKMAVFEGSQKTIFKDRKDLTGSLLQQLEDAYSFIDKYNRTRSEFKGLERIYPLEAIREALLNAIVHRDYSMSASTLISIFDDRIEFITIGGLVKGISYEDILLGVSALRNERLANIFYRLDLIEAYGTGMLKINECYAESKEKPKIEISDHAFKITLPNLNYMKENLVTQYSTMKEENIEDKALLLFENKESVTRKELQKFLNVSQTSAINILAKLLKKGIIVKQNSGRNSNYRFNK